jgi:hypothetical protein
MGFSQSSVLRENANEPAPVATVQQSHVLHPVFTAVL